MHSNPLATTKAILFDFDDTLVASREAKWAQHKTVARTHYNLELTDEELLKHWGKPLPQMVQAIYQTDDIPLALERASGFRGEFPKLLFPETMAVLETAHQKGFKLGIVTATTRASLTYDLNRLNFPLHTLDYLQTAEESEFHKPDPRVFDPAIAWLEEQGLTPDQVVYVGDARHDREAAVSAGFGFIGVCTGLVSPESFEAEGTTYCSKVGDLLEYL